jgi:hypothetical protein
VQFGHRTQNSASKKFQRLPIQRLPARSGSGSGSGNHNSTSSDAAPMSAARLAAEAAFAPAPVHDAPPLLLPAQVVVRRARGAPLTLAAAAATDSAGPSAASSTKGPRVFRVEAAASPIALADDHPRWPATTNGHDGVAHMPTSRPRRTAADKRPGPVLHVVHALPARPEPAPQAQRLDELTVQLARLEPVLADIRRAQAFRLVDESCAREWQRLSGVADDIRRALGLMLR